MFFLRSLLLPEFRSNTCDRIPAPQQLKKESQKSCPTDYKPHNRGLNLRSASGGGCGKIPLHGGQSFPQARRNPNICTTNANHVYSHFSLQRKERKARENKKKTWENRTRKRCVETEKHQPSEITNLSRSSPPGETTKAAGILYLPQTTLSLCLCLYLSVRFSSISLLCRQGQKQVKFKSYFVC